MRCDCAAPSPPSMHRPAGHRSRCAPPARRTPTRCHLAASSPRQRSSAPPDRWPPELRGRHRRWPDPGSLRRRESLSSCDRIPSASVIHAVARAIFRATTSRRTMAELLPKPLGGCAVNHPGRRSPVPPVNHRARAKVSPCVRSAFDEQPAIAGNLEPELGRRRFEIDQIHGAASGTAERRLNPVACGNLVEQHRDVDVAVPRASAARRGTEQRHQTDGGKRLRRLDKTTFEGRLCGHGRQVM